MELRTAARYPPVLDASQDGAVHLRPPSEVMTLDRLGAFQQTRLSFMRALVRRMQKEAWTFNRNLFDLDDEGYGRAVYHVNTPAGACSLVAFSDALDPSERTDRVIAERWDATFALVLGTPDGDYIEELAENVPRQEGGRYRPHQVVLSRANRSVRLFEGIVNALAEGRQPELASLLSVGYVMRTTAVYGNGKFGMADLLQAQRQGPFRGAFEAEMLTVYLIRQFTLDLVEHVARARAPERAVPLAQVQRRALGIGNSTGLGMAPFMIAHPALLHRWIAARETALSRVCAIPRIATDMAESFQHLVSRAVRHCRQWNSDDPVQADRNARLAQALDGLGERLTGRDSPLRQDYPWAALMNWAGDGSLDLQETLVSLILEPNGPLVDDLVESMHGPEPVSGDTTRSLGFLKLLIESQYDWALQIDHAVPASTHFFWYRSEEKEEPRIGVRAEEPGADLEMRIGVARMVQSLYAELCRSTHDNETPIAAFLAACPDYRWIVQRILVAAEYPYGEVRDNLVGHDCIPVNLLRCKLSFFGAVKFDPRSERWLRICMYQGAPYPDELPDCDPDSWAFPVFDAEIAS